MSRSNRALSAGPLGAAQRVLSLVAGDGDDHVPLAGRLRLVRAHWQLRRGDPTRALVGARRLGVRYPRAAAPRALAGLALVHLDQRAEAMHAAREAVTLAPLSAGIARIVGSIAARAGDYELAVDRFAFAAAARPTDAWLLSRLGEAQLHLGRTADALGSIEQALSLQPGPRLLALKGLALQDLGKDEEAIPCLEGAIALGVRSAKTVGTLAKALTELQRGVDAIAVVKAYAPVEERDRSLARVCLRLRRFEKALRHADAAVAAAPEDPRNHEVRAAALRSMGNVSGARAALTEARRLGEHPPIVGFERALHPAAALARARDHLRAARHDEALRSVEQALRWEPENSRALAARARVQNAMGDFEGSLRSIGEARDVADDPEFERLEHRVRGWVRALSAGWIPGIDGQPERIRPVRDRIIHLLDRSLPYLHTGYTQRSEYIVQSQRAAGLDPIIVTRLGYPQIAGVESYEPVETVNGIVHHRLTVPGVDDYERLPRDLYLEYYAAEAAKIVERVRPAILNPAASYLNGLVGLALKKRYGLPMVYEVRGFYEDLWASRRGDPGTSDGYEGRVRAETMCMARADRVVTLAEVMKAEIVARGVDPSHVVVVPNAVDTERFAPRPPDVDLASSLGLTGRVVLGYVSNLTHWEAVDSLVRAISILRGRGMPVAALIVGGGPEFDALRRLTDALGLGADVVLTGRVPHDDVPRYYSIMDVFVVSRRRLRLCDLVTPLKPFEAMAMGLPLLVSDLAALREIVAPEARGFTFAPEDPEDLAARVAPLVQDRDLRRRIGDAAREWVCRERTWRQNAATYHALYEELLEERAPSRA